MEDKAVLATLIQRTKEGNALDVVPMEVGDKDVGRDGLAVRLAFELLP
jgi:hypothetical protein